MTHFPILRWGEPYKSLEVERVSHFATGEPIAEVSLANAAMIARDMSNAQRARDILREIPCSELINRLARAADLFLNAQLPAGDGSQTPDEFVRCQSSTTGLPEHMCRFNMTKLHHVLTHLGAILASLTRGLDLSILTRGYGEESGLLRSLQAQTPVLGLVLPSNSPGVHGLWLPVIPLQVGLVLKPGPQEPWTPYRMAEAMFAAGIPRQAISIYPGGAAAGAAVVEHCPRVMIFGSTQTVEQHKGNPRVQVHGPGFSKILLGDDAVDDWETHIDLMAHSILVNSGRGCINASGVWASRHTEAIAEALAARLGPIEPKPHDDPTAQLAAFTVPTQADAVDAQISSLLKDATVTEVTSRHRNGERLVRKDRCAFLRPTILHVASPDSPAAQSEYMFPFASVVRCPQDQMIRKIGPTLVASAITSDEPWRQQLIDATNIDRLNLGPIPTVQLNWLQPHEGSVVDFLFRSRAFQVA